MAKLKQICFPVVYSYPAGFCREEWAARLDPVLLLWSRLKAANPVVLEEAPDGDASNASPVEGFVMSEILDSYNTMQVIASSLFGIIQVSAIVFFGRGSIRFSKRKRPSRPWSWRMQSVSCQVSTCITLMRIRFRFYPAAMDQELGGH